MVKPSPPSLNNERAGDLSTYFHSLRHESGIGAIPLHRLSRREPLVFHPESSLRDALIALNKIGTDAGLVAQEGHIPLGIITIRNLLDGLTLQGGTMDDPVIAFMTAAPLSLPEDAPVHRAKILMTRSRLSHLMLTQISGRVTGLLSQKDIPGFREGGADEFTDQIAAAGDIDTIAQLADRVRKRGAELFVGGMGVEALCQWMSGLNDLIVMQIIEVTADTFDLPPIPWGWMVFGSEGRLEQTFTTDQDNGLIFQPERRKNTEAIRQAFLPFALAVNNALDRCGFDLCKGNIMASNPAWCLAMEEWQAKFRRWMDVPEPEALLNTAIFFDFRPLYGQDELVYDLRKWLLLKPSQHDRLLYGLCSEALSCAPSLGLWGRFIYDGGKQYPRTINLKMHGARPFVDAARIWSLKHQIWATNTADRLRALANIRKLPLQDVSAAIEAFDFIQRLRIHQQLSSRDPGQVNRVNPKNLNTLQKLLLKEAFNQARSLQMMLKQEFFR